MFWIEKGLAASEIDLLHAGFFEKHQTLLRRVKRLDVRGFCRVEAESTFIVAFASEMVVHRNWDKRLRTRLENSPDIINDKEDAHKHNKIHPVFCVLIPSYID